MAYAQAAWEQAMRMQDVILRAISGELHWFTVADILGMTPRNLRRWRERYERWGYNGLVDQRRCPPWEGSAVPAAHQVRGLHG
ncbi:MAG: helix-turn-helix domain-containing protein, partial [Luteitalea sp.]|nr:helix-turn-helix domain-containing protein [Luteitalea sp.]